MKSSANGNEKPTENRCSDLLNDECSHFRRGNNYGVECVRTQRQRLHLDPRRGRSEPYSSRAYRVADRTAPASTLRPVAHKIVRDPRVAMLAAIGILIDVACLPAHHVLDGGL